MPISSFDSELNNPGTPFNQYQSIQVILLSEIHALSWTTRPGRGKRPNYNAVF